MKSHTTIIRTGLFLLAGSFLFSCQKTALKETAVPASQTVAKYKVPSWFTGKEGLITNRRFEFRSMDVATHAERFSRIIQVKSLITGDIVNTIVLSVISDDPAQDMYQALLDKNFTGTLTMESNGYVFLEKRAVSGVDMDMPDNGFSEKNAIMGIVYNYPTVTGCLLSKLNNSGWIGYAASLVDSPEDYLLPWADCVWYEKDKDNVNGK
ncbi:MAG: hypothetical protein IPP73_10395 [Chitinophagaceae bacterium]|nr:hypothetical protein [Chitinophagaceae bacterium]